MGYDYKVESGTNLVVSIGCEDWNKKINIDVKEGQEIYYEIYMEDGELSER